MFAVLNTGGKQYKVSQGDLIEVEKLESDVGDTGYFKPSADGWRRGNMLKWGTHMFLIARLPVK